MIVLKFIVVGVGPGDAGNITVGALETIKNADLVLMPHSADGRPSVAEQVVTAHLKDLQALPVVFPMINDAEARDSSLKQQLEALRPSWQNAATVVLPVIGDASLYATGAYLYDVWTELVPELSLGLVPGISAYSFAAARSDVFLAMGEDILTIIPGTAPLARIRKALAAADSAAVFKPSALRDKLKTTVACAGPWKKILRIDRAGLPDEKVWRGEAALAQAQEYLSILLLWR